MEREGGEGVETIIFNNKNALENFDILIGKEYDIPFVQEQVELEQVEGRSGTLTKRLGTYEDINISLELIATNTEDFRPLIRKITKWLTEVEDERLVFTDNREKYLKVKKVVIGNIVQDILKSGKFTVQFICDPFYYNYYESPITITSNSTVLNDGDIESPIKLLLEGVSGNISIRVNNREVQFKGVTGAINVNSGLYRAIDGNGQSITNKMTGDFPYLDKGNNTIVITGTFTKATLTKNCRYKG